MGEVTEEELRGLARDGLAPAKRPKDYFFVGELPHTASGKVRRLDLAVLADPDPRPG